MDITQLFELVQNFGITIFIVGYFAYKDFNKEKSLTQAVYEINSTLLLFGQKLDSTERSILKELER